MTTLRGLLGIGLFASALARGAPLEIVDRVNFNPLLDAAADAIESQVNDGFLSVTSRTSFLDNFAKAGTSGTAALAADRADRPAAFLLGVTAQAGVQGNLRDVGSAGTNSLPAVGAGGQAAVLLGIPGGRLFGKSADRWAFFLSGGGAGLTAEGVRFEMLNAGLNGVYQLVREKGPSRLARWGGLRFATGVNYARGKVGYGGALDQSSGGMSVNLNLDLNVESSNVLVPLELSTSLQLLYLFQVYGGGSLDLNFGSARFSGISSGPVDTGVPGSTATAVLNLDDGARGKTTTTVGRGFVGVQLYVYALRVGAEYTVLSNDTTAVAAFVKLGL